MRKRIFWNGLLMAVFLLTGISPVWAAPPVAQFSADVTSGPGPLSVVFTDLSADAPASWAWDFNNDGVADSSSQNPTYSFSTYGPNTVSLTVTNVDGASTETKIDYITVATGVNFTARNNQTSGPGPFRARFNDRVTSDVVALANYVWDFGDSYCDPADNTSTATDPTHYYNYPGTYTVSLTATGTDGTFTETKTNFINVSTGANIGLNTQSGKAPVTVTFSGTGSSDVTSWLWDFGRGAGDTSSAQNPGAVEYAAPGMYKVTLTVTGDTGDATDTEIIVAADPWTKTVTKLASATPDECFNGIGLRVDPVSLDPFTCPDPDSETGLPIPMTNQTYTWSLTEVDLPDLPGPPVIPGNHSLWFGTGANVLCTTQGALLSEVDEFDFGSAVCEFEESPMVDLYPQLFSTPLTQALADWRRAKIYRYDLDSGLLVDRTPPQSDGLFNICLGLRSGFSHGNVVIFAGGSFPGFGQAGGNTGVVMFAYNARTGQYIGSRNFPQYRTVRKGKVIAGNLYIGVGAIIDPPALGAGRILKWIGQVDSTPTAAEVLQFQEVGNMPNISISGPAYGGTVRELTEYIDGDGNSRIAVSAKGVWLSPPIPVGGLTASHLNGWNLVHSPEQYEPDFVSLQTYVGGGIESLNGWIYWATMHIPGNTADVHSVCTIPPLPITLFGADQCMGAYVEANTSDGRDLNSAEFNSIANNTFRSTTLWRIKNAETDNPTIQLLFGESQLGAFDPDGGYDPDDPEADPNDAWTLKSTGHTPLMGSSGYNNPYNNYGWVMQKVGDRIFAGTMDYSTLSRPDQSPNSANPFPVFNYGADIWQISGGAGDALPLVIPETTNAFKGFDNAGPGVADLYDYMPYGIRTLAASSDGTKLFVGVASGNNLNAVDSGNGWSLLQMDSIAAASCSWDIEPDGSDRDYDVDGLDFNAAANMSLSQDDLLVLAQQYGSANCSQ